MLEEATWDLLDKTELQHKVRNKIDLLLFDECVGCVEE